jgi:hypothetical protein
MIPAMDQKRSIMRFDFILRLFVLLFAVVVIAADSRFAEMKGVHLRVTGSQVKIVVEYHIILVPAFFYIDRRFR